MRTEIVHVDEGLVLAVRGVLVVGIWSRPSYERHVTAFRVVREVERVAGRPVAILSVSPQGAPVPSVDDFPALAHDAAAATSSIRAMAIVFEGHGPWMERALEDMSTLDSVRVAIRPDSFARKFATSVEEGATWIATQLRHSGDGDLDRNAVLETVELARTHVH